MRKGTKKRLIHIVDEAFTRSISGTLGGTLSALLVVVILHAGQRSPSRYAYYDTSSPEHGYSDFSPRYYDYSVPDAGSYYYTSSPKSGGHDYSPTRNRKQRPSSQSATHIKNEFGSTGFKADKNSRTGHGSYYDTYSPTNRGDTTTHDYGYADYSPSGSGKDYYSYSPPTRKVQSASSAAPQRKNDFGYTGFSANKSNRADYGGVYASPSSKDSSN